MTCVHPRPAPPLDRRYIADASKVRESRVTAPPGCALLWSGQDEAMARVRERLPVAIPVTRFLVVVLLCLSTQSFAKTAVVCWAVPFVPGTLRSVKAGPSTGAQVVRGDD
jgi:Cu/Ag efflux pump CusA